MILAGLAEVLQVCSPFRGMSEILTVEIFEFKIYY